MTKQEALCPVADIVQSDSVLINSFLDKRYEMILSEEDDISWQTQNSIHKLLNQAYARKTKQFVAKTYAYMRPTQRILVFQNEQLVGHCALATNYATNIKSDPIPVGYIGLLASIAKTSISPMLIQEVLNIYIQKGYEFVIAHSTNVIILKKILPQFDCTILDVPIIGVSTQTKTGTKAIIFPLAAKGDYNLSSLSGIQVSKEIF